MKRWWILLCFCIIASVLCLARQLVSGDVIPEWLNPATVITAQPLQRDVKPEVYCNDGYSVVTDRKLVGCFDGSVYTSVGKVEMRPTDMSFGSLTPTGVFTFGPLSYGHAVQLPDNYQLFPIAQTGAALLVDNGQDDHQPVPVAYYPDIARSVDWVRRRLEPPAEQQFFPDGPLHLEVSPFNLASSANGQWVVANSVSNGMVRLDLTRHQFNRFGTSYRILAGGRLVKPLPVSAIANDGQTALLGYADDAGGTQIYDASLADCLDEPLSCKKRTITPLLKQVTPDFSYIVQARFETDEVIVLTTSDGKATNPSYARYRMSIKPVLAQNSSYIALGDSFASGEGAYFYHSGTDSPPNKCHLSASSYPYLLRADAHSVACSGARVKDVDGTAWGQRTGRSKDSYGVAETDKLLREYTPGNLNQLEYLRTYHPATATVMVGGNDIGFSGILKQCIDPRRSAVSAATCYSTYEDRFELIQSIYDYYDNFRRLFNRLQTASPETSLYAIGYPQVISTQGSCGFNVQLNDQERQLTVAITDALNLTLARAAQASGVHFVDTSNAFEGHKLCQSGAAAMHGITAGDDGLYVAGRYLLGQESFHPTALGQQLLAQAIRTQTYDLTLGKLPVALSTKPEVSPLFPFLEGVAQAGRALRTRVVDDTIAADNPDGAVSISVDNSDYRLRPFQNVTISLGTQTYQAATDGRGAIALSVPIVSNGFQTIHVYAEDQSGNTLDLTKVIEGSVNNGAPSLTLQVGQFNAKISNGR